MTDLCALKDVKSLRKSQGGTYTGYDELTLQAIATSSELVRKFTRRKFDQAACSEQFRLTLDSGFQTKIEVVFLKEPPITGLVLKIAGFKGKASATAVDPATYVLNAQTGRLEFEYASTFADPMYGFHNAYLFADYTGGYAVPPDDNPSKQRVLVGLPDAIRLGTALQAGAMLTRLIERTSQNTAHKVASPEQIAFSSWGEGIVPQARALLMPDRRVMTGRG